MINIYVDGACSGNGTANSNTGVGIYSNELNIQESYRFGNGSNNTAEFLGIIVALENLKEKGITDDVIIHSDSKYVINAVEKNYKLKSPASAILKNYIQANLNTSPNVSLKYIDRSRNILADDLAKAGKEKEQIDSIIIAGVDLTERVREEYKKKEKKKNKPKAR